MNFNFCIGKINRPTVTITMQCIKFNKEAIKLLGTPKYISIGLNKDSKKLAFKAATEKNFTEPVYPFATTADKQAGVTVSAKAVRSEAIGLLYQKPIVNAIVFLLDLDNDTKYGIVDLSKPI